MSEPINQTFIQKLTGKRRILIFAGILAVAVVHTAMQLSFIQGEKLRSAELTAAAPIEEDKLPALPAAETKQDKTRILEIKPEEYEVRKVKVVTIPERVEPAVRRQQQTETVQPAVKRKVIRTESKAERLRRAEKILTGV